MGKIQENQRKIGAARKKRKLVNTYTYSLTWLSYLICRLVAGTTIGESNVPTKGAIHPYQGRIAPKSPLICSNVAEGHTKAVLSVFATDELLFSASKVIY